MTRTALLLAAAFWSCSSPPSSAPEAAKTTQPLAAKTPESAARAYLEANARKYGLTPSTLRLVQLHDTGRGGLVVVFRSQVNGVDVIERDVKVLLKRDLTPMTLMTRPMPGASHLPFVLSEDDAIALAMRQLPDANPVRRARAWRVYFPTAERLIPAFKVELARNAGSYAFIVDAFAARVVRTTSLTHGAPFTYRVFADDTGAKTPWDAPLADFTPHPTGVPGGPQPAFVSPRLVVNDGFNSSLDPWLDAAATQTQGNNVDAYTDDDSPDGFSANDVRAITTGASTFDFTYDTSLAPTANLTQRRAVAANAFYVTNWLHDSWYDSGFDEAGGNAQDSNLGRGGVEGDRLHVAVQYAPTTQRNNATADVTADGESPTLHFFLFDAVPEGSLTVNGESHAWATADFGPQTFNVTAQLMLADDGSAAPTLGCNALVGNYTGKIVLADRGTCTFISKAQRAQAAGAAGLLIANNVAGAGPFGMTGTGTTTIPVMGLSTADSAVLKAQLQQGTVSVTMARTASPLRDSALDNTIVSHEWGHYLHLRLTSSNSYMTAAESEGWADFTALHMILKPGDALNGVYGLAQYAMGDAYFGIRREPYSTDFTKNALTFKHVADGTALPTTVPTLDNGGPNSEVHNTGEVWATALFGAYVALQTRAQATTPPYTFAEAKRRMADYVVAGMKLAPADATFTEMRDALLYVTFAADADDGSVMAQAFAVRGFGTCAISPPRDSTDFVGVVESFDVKPTPVVTLTGLVDDTFSCDQDGLLDSGEAGHVTVRIDNIGMAALTGATVTLSSSVAGLTFTGGATLSVPAIAPFEHVELQVPVQLASTVTRAQVLDVTAVLDSTDVCSTAAPVSRWWHGNLDETPNAANTDSVEAQDTTWTLVTLFDGGAEASQVWLREAVDAGETAWHALDYGGLSETALVSPEMQVGDAGLTLSFRHRFQFERSSNTNFDGALLEVQTDGGAWQPVTAPSYGGAITTTSNNPLGGRQGYVGDSAGWPAFATETVNFGAAFAGKSMRVRFVVATDEAEPDTGWYLDDLAFTGAVNTPFTTLAPEAAACVPPAPVATPQTLTTAEDTVLNVTLSATGTGALTYAVVTQPAHGRLNGTPPALTYTPAADFNGSDSFTFSATDSASGAGNATVSLTVTPVNDAPVASPATTSTQSNSPVSVTLDATDVDGDALTFTISTQPVHGTLSGTPPEVTYTPEAGFSDADTFSFTASDGVATSAPATVTVTVIGTVTLDAGMPQDDAGTHDADGGTTTTDGGTSTADGGTHGTDGGVHTFDAGVPGTDGGSDSPGTPKGCGCTSGFELLPLAFLLLFRRRSSR